MARFSANEKQVIAQFEDDFIRDAYDMYGRGKIPNSQHTRNLDFIDWFGATPTVVAQVWYLLQDGYEDMPRGANQERLLWGLYLNKNYGTSRGMARMVGVDKDTFRRWSWWMLNEVSFLEAHVVSKLMTVSFYFCLSHPYYYLQIQWERRKINDIGNDCMVYVDGVDCQYKTCYNHRGKPDNRFYSQKFKKSGLRYKVASCIRSDEIVWISGPHLPGVKNDLMIFRESLMHMLDPGERVEADAIYAAEAPQFVKV